MSDYNPNSLDAQMSKVLTLLEEHEKRFSTKCEEDRAAFAAIMAKQDKTNGRVNALESWRSEIREKLTLLATGVSGTVTLIGWAIAHYWK